MELENILKLIDAVSNSSLTSFAFDDGVTKLTLESKPAAETQVQYVVNTPDMIQSASSVSEAVNKSDSEHAAISGNVVKSPLVGVFYSASSPDAEAFVKVGDTVTKGQTLGIVEAMKLMNEIECDYDGVVKDILIENNDIVEYGQPLFIIS